MIQQQTRTRVENPARWMKAAERAITEGIQVRQLQGSGQWIASSGRDSTVAYEIDVTGNVAHGCDCLAGLNGDPCCKHRAAFYLLIGALDLTPEPDPPALGAGSHLPGLQWLRGSLQPRSGTGGLVVSALHGLRWYRRPTGPKHRRLERFAGGMPEKLPPAPRRPSLYGHEGPVEQEESRDGHDSRESLL